jgi:hypothetical protein
MTDIEARIDEVQTGPRGRRIAAFFDFDRGPDSANVR